MKKQYQKNGESTIIPIYKQKGNMINCEIYQGTKLTEHGIKILERIVDKRLTEIVDIRGLNTDSEREWEHQIQYL